MTIKVIRQNHKKVMSYRKVSSSLSRINADTDQALMNFDYETMKIKEVNEAFTLLQEMVYRYREIIGR